MRDSLLASSRATVAAGTCWVVAGIVYLLAEAVTASAFPGYSYAVNYISDLGVPDIETLGGRAIDSPLHVVIIVGFVIQGALLLAGAVAAARGTRFRLRRTFVAFALIHATGMILIALVHGGQANIDAGLARVHLLGAAMAMFGGQLTAIVAGISWLATARTVPDDAVGRALTDSRLGALSIALGVIGVLGIVMLEIDVRAVPATILDDGVWERIGLYAVIVWELAIGAAALTWRPDPQRIGAPGPSDGRVR